MLHSRAFRTHPHAAPTPLHVTPTPLHHQGEMHRIGNERAQLAQKLEAEKEKLSLGCRLEFPIAREVIGLVVGQKGKNIIDTQKATGVDRVEVTARSSVQQRAAACSSVQQRLQHRVAPCSRVHSILLQRAAACDVCVDRVAVSARWPAFVARSPWRDCSPAPIRSPPSPRRPLMTLG